MQSINFSDPNYSITPAENRQMLDTLLGEIDAAIESHTTSRKAKGLDVNSSTWLSEMRVIRNRAEKGMLELLNSGQKFIVADCYLITQQAIRDLSAAQERFNAGSKLAEKIHSQATERHQCFLDSAKGCTVELLSSKSLAAKKQGREEMSPEMKAETLALVKDTMADVRLITAGIELAETAVIESAKLVFCGLPGSEGRKNCRAVATFAAEQGKAAVTAVGLKEPIKKMLSAWNSIDGSSTATLLTSLDVPEDEAKQLAAAYISDIKHLSLASLPIGTSCGVAKKGISYTCNKSVQATEQAAAKSLARNLATLPEETAFSTINIVQSAPKITSKNDAVLIPEILIVENETIKSFVAKPPKLNQSAKTNELVFTSEAARQEAKAFDLNYVDNPTYKRRLAESQKVETAKEQKREWKQKNGLIGLEQKVARQQVVAEGYKQDRALLSELSKEHPLQLPKQLVEAFEAPAFLSSMRKNTYPVFHARIGNDTAYFIPHGYSGQPLETTLQKATSNLTGRGFITFDPQVHSFQEVHKALKTLSQDVVGVGKLPRGEFNPFIVIEVATKP